ncbi:MAG TPA: hypothetical protein VGJ46_07370 [Candidatus Limnocylindrales bacterium]
MAILAGIFGVIGRYAGRVLTTALGWASMLLFGRVPQSRQVLLAAATFGSLIWAVLLAGVVLPTVASLLLVAVPPPSFVDPLWIRVAMLAGAVVLPIAIGIAMRMIPEPEDRARGRAAVTDILRGYPLGAALAVTLVFLAGVAVAGKARSLARRWKDAHVPIVVKPNGYEKVVSDLEDALDGAGLDVSRRPASRALTVPARVLAAVAGTGVRGLVPDRLTMLVGRDLEVTVHLSDVAVAGRGLKVAQARAAIASRLTSTAAHLTTSAESRAIEDLIESLAPGPSVVPPSLEAPRLARLQEIDEKLKSTELPYDEWEILYRMRLQVERDLLRAAAGGRVVGNREGVQRRGRQPVAGAAQRTGSSAMPRPQAIPTPSGLIALGVIGLLLLDVILAITERAEERRR